MNYLVTREYGEHFHILDDDGETYCGRPAEGEVYNQPPALPPCPICLDAISPHSQKKEVWKSCVEPFRVAKINKGLRAKKPIKNQLHLLEAQIFNGREWETLER